MSDALQFFNTLSGRLKVELNEPARPISERVVNLVASPDAKVLAVSLRMQVYLEDEEDFRELTTEEWDRLVLAEDRIRIRGEGDVVVEHHCPGGFTVRKLADAIAETERQSRGSSEWLGGVDVHHVFFEGISLENGVWSVYWGS